MEDDGNEEETYEGESAAVECVKILLVFLLNVMLWFDLFLSFNLENIA